MEIKNIKDKNKNECGFSFVEVLVSIFLVSIGLIAAVSLISSNLVKTINNRNQSVAGLLAQEGVELVVNIRDNNAKSATASSSFDLNLPDGSAASCIIDPAAVITGQLVLLCDSNLNNRLFYSSSLKGYFHEVTISDPDKKETKFRRKISISYDAGNSTDASSMVVTSMVIWDEDVFPEVNKCNSSTKCTYAETTLTKWRD